ncbi:MAG: SpoIIE family protein phosphatase [bacterium]|nr:SpoIIE family protein phosphatase [bacterium]
MERKVLVVDDEPDVEIMIRQRFRAEIKQGRYEFVFARDGVEALEIFRDLEVPPLVVTDIRMPRMDGLTLLAEISKIDPIQRVIIVSAYGDMSNIRAAMNDGAFDFLTKPMDFEDFQSTVDRGMEYVALQEANRRRDSEFAVIKHELELAQKIQASILPSRMPVLPGLGVHSFYEPMSAVGGDFFGFHESDGHLGVLVADVVGHGVPAAMIASIVRVAFNIQKDRDRDAAEVLLGMERVLLESGMMNGNFVTACYVSIDLKSRRLQTANAGHPPLLIHRPGGEVVSLRPSGSILGFLKEGGAEVAEFDLSAGDRIFAFTDGLFECGHGDNVFGQERLLQTFRENAEAKAEDFMQRLIEQLSDWNRRHGPSDGFEDDLTAVIVDIQD